MRVLATEQNLITKHVVDYLHQAILANPEKHQRYTHQEVGKALGVHPKKVQLSLAHADATGITLEVTAKDRAAIRKAMREQRSRV